MNSRRGKLYTFERYPELAVKIRNHFGMLGHQKVSIQGGEEELVDIFEKIKVMFFELHLDNEHLTELIKNQPLAFFTRSIQSVIKCYQEHFESAQKQNKQEVLQYKLQINRLKQQVSDYIILTQALKDEINQLEQQKTSAELRLDQSESNLGFIQSKQQLDQIERKKLELQKINAMSYSCKLEKQIAILHQQIFQLERRETIYKQSKNQYLLIKKESQQLEMAHNQALNKIIELQQDLQLIKRKYHEKAHLYERYVQEHNQQQRYSACQFSSPALSRETFGQQRIKSRADLQKSNELNGLIFNLTDSQQMTSKTSQLSIGDHLNIIDYESTPYQLSKSPSCGDNRVVIEKQSSNINSVKKSIKLQQNTSKKYEINVSKQKSFKNNQVFSQSKPLHSNAKQEAKISQFNPSSNKKISSLQKNWNSPNTKGYIDSILKQKLNEKNMHIQKLQGQLEVIRALCVSQKQNLTMMQGDYQIQLEELKDLLAYTKKQIKILFRKYCSNKALCQSYQSKINELQEQVQKLRLEYKSYCSLLQNKCKEYILSTLTSIEQDYLEMVELMNSNKNKLHSTNEDKVIKEEKRQSILIFDQKTEDNDSAQKVQSESDVFSLDFQKMKKIRQNNSSSEIFICENLEIQTQLSFKITDKANIKGNFTERTSKTVENYPETYERGKLMRRINHMKIDSNVITYFISLNQPKEWKICNLQHLSVQRKSLRIESKQLEFRLQAFQRKPKILKLCSLDKIKISKRFAQLKYFQRELQYKILPHRQTRNSKRQNKITTSPVVQIRSESIFHRAPRQSTFSIKNMYNLTFHYKQRLHNLSIQFQDKISIPAQSKIIIEISTQTTDSVDSLASSNQASPERSSFISNVSYLESMSNQLLKVKAALLEELQKKNLQNKNIKYQKKSTITSKIYNLNISTNIQDKEEQAILRKENNLRQNAERYIKIQVESSTEIFNSVSNLLQQVKKISDNVRQQMDQQIYEVPQSISQQCSEDEIISMFSTQRAEEINKNNFGIRTQPLRYKDQENIDPNRNWSRISIKEASLKVENETADFIPYNQRIQQENWTKSQDITLKQANNKQCALNKHSVFKEDSQIQLPTQEYQCDESVSQLLEQREMQLILKYLPNRNSRIIMKTQYTSIDDFFNQKRFNRSTFCYLFLSKKNQSKAVTKIIVTNKYLIDLSSNKDIIFENCRRYFDNSNFMFGQAEVVLTKSGLLEINRKNKYKKLKGSLLDNRYQIQKLFSLSIK